MSAFLLRQLVRDAIVSLVDADAWEREQIVEADERNLLLKLAEEFHGV